MKVLYHLVVPDSLGSWEAPDGVVYEAGTHVIEDEATVKAAREASPIGVGVRRVQEGEVARRPRRKARRRKESEGGADSWA